MKQRGYLWSRKFVKTLPVSQVKLLQKPRGCDISILTRFKSENYGQQTSSREREDEAKDGFFHVPVLC